MSLREQIEGLAEQSATSSRDFGRGYSQAVRDVVALTDVAWSDARLYDRLTVAFHEDANMGHGTSDTAQDCGHCSRIVRALTTEGA